jgi:hypothetical protein
MAGRRIGSGVVLAEGSYLGTTSVDLAATGKATLAKAIINRSVLFPGRGSATLFADRLVLTGWYTTGEVTLYPSEIDDIELSSHGQTSDADMLRRFGDPIVVRRIGGDKVYLLLNYRRFLVRSADNARWFELLTHWLRVGHSTGRGRR